MAHLSRFVTLVPYFQVNTGQLDAFKALLPTFIEQTSSEPKNLFYDFTINGDIVNCREGYTDADGVLTHLQNVGATLEKALQLSAIARLEVHGPAAELDKLCEPLGSLNPSWFVYEAGLSR